MWRPGKLLTLLLWWTGATTVIFWLPFLRAPMDGDSYSWGLFPGIGGQGVSGHYWLPVLGVTYALSTLYLGWRGAKRPFHWLLLLWHLPLGGGFTYFALFQPDALPPFRGDTLGIEFSTAGPFAGLFGGFALLSLWWVLSDLRAQSSRTSPMWTRANKLLGALVVALLPVQFLPASFGRARKPC